MRHRSPGEAPFTLLGGMSHPILQMRRQSLKEVVTLPKPQGKWDNGDPHRPLAGLYLLPISIYLPLLCTGHA